jgi:hypothetical protein
VVRGQQIRAASKNVLEWGKWQTGGMLSSAFPLSKRRGRAYQLGASYRWRIIRFEALDVPCRLLIAFNLAKEQYRATLALERDRDMSVIASLEFHGTHPGWHLHGACGDTASIPLGSLRGLWQKRMPLPRKLHRRAEFGITDDITALNMASKFFRLHKREGALL